MTRRIKVSDLTVTQREFPEIVRRLADTYESFESFNSVPVHIVNRRGIDRHNRHYEITVCNRVLAYPNTIGTLDDLVEAPKLCSRCGKRDDFTQALLQYIAHFVTLNNVRRLVQAEDNVRRHWYRVGGEVEDLIFAEATENPEMPITLTAGDLLQIIKE